MSSRIQTGAMVTVYEGPLTQLCRGAARAVTAVVLALSALFTILEGVPNPFFITGRENLALFTYFVMGLGLYLGFRWERAATALVLPAFTLFTLINFPIAGSVWMGWFYLSFPVAAMLYWLGRRRQPDRRGV